MDEQEFASLLRHKRDPSLIRLVGVNLSGMNLEWVRDLKGIDLSIANLIDTDLSCVNLSGANLLGASLERTNLRGANLSGSNLRNANLRSAKLNRSDLRGAILIGAHLGKADLSHADLRNAQLNGAHLWAVNLHGANLENADLRFAIGNNNEIKNIKAGIFEVVICHPTKVAAIDNEQLPIAQWLVMTEEEAITRSDEFWVQLCRLRPFFEDALNK